MSDMYNVTTAFSYSAEHLIDTIMMGIKLAIILTIVYAMIRIAMGVFRDCREENNFDDLEDEEDDYLDDDELRLEVKNMKSQIKLLDSQLKEERLKNKMNDLAEKADEEIKDEDSLIDNFGNSKRIR